MSKDIEKWGDAAQFTAAPIKGDGISASLLWMTPDPLGAVAAACRMYEGYPTYSLDEITDDDRVHYWDQVQATHLKAPLEFIKMHWFIEGVDRAFTHQMVRQRTAVFAQESMRFAVKDNMANEVALPPSIQPGSRQAADWERALTAIQGAYDSLVNAGVPAEDARGLMPHATPTRLNYATDLRAMADHAGNRLCTQAQFVWREVFTQFRQQLREGVSLPEEHKWQGELLSQLFLPVCYQKGSCPFKAKFDRGCSIRERVDKFEAEAVPSDEWDDRDKHGEDAIHPAEWLANPDAARVKVGDTYGDQSHRRQ